MAPHGSNSAVDAVLKEEGNKPKLDEATLSITEMSGAPHTAQREVLVKVSPDIPNILTPAHEEAQEKPERASSISSESSSSNIPEMEVRRQKRAWLKRQPRVRQSSRALIPRICERPSTLLSVAANRQLELQWADQFCSSLSSSSSPSRSLTSSDDFNAFSSVDCADDAHDFLDLDPFDPPFGSVSGEEVAVVREALLAAIAYVGKSEAGFGDMSTEGFSHHLHWTGMEMEREEADTDD